VPRVALGQRFERRVVAVGQVGQGPVPVPPGQAVVFAQLQIGLGVVGPGLEAVEVALQPGEALLSGADFLAAFLRIEHQAGALGLARRRFSDLAEQAGCIVAVGVEGLADQGQRQIQQALAGFLGRRTFHRHGECGGLARQHAGGKRSADLLDRAECERCVTPLRGEIARLAQQYIAQGEVVLRFAPLLEQLGGQFDAGGRIAGALQVVLENFQDQLERFVLCCFAGHGRLGRGPRVQEGGHQGEGHQYRNA
jgi:hypothetical protein